MWHHLQKHQFGFVSTFINVQILRKNLPICKKKACTLFCLEKFNAISPPPSSIIYLHHMKFGDHLWCFSSEYNAMEHPRKKYARQNDDKPICLTSQKCFLMSSQILPRILQITRHESFPRKKHNQFLVFTGLN